VPRLISNLVLIACLAICLASCTHLKYASAQSEYARIQNAEPGQVNVKHMIDREKFFVHGQCNDAAADYDSLPKVIVAFSSKYQPHELVDKMHFEVAGSHYGMSLPEGQYDLVVFADIDNNGVFGRSEVVGRRAIALDKAAAPDMVLGQVNVPLSEPETIDWDVEIQVPDTQRRAESVFYPAGTLRTLDDPIFDASFATLGMYDPAAFLEQAPTMFYALEEDFGFKIPVIFVVCNNRLYKAVRDAAVRFKGKAVDKNLFIGSSIDDPAPDLAQIARGFGVSAATVTVPEDIKPALEKALQADAPFVLDVRIAQ